MGQFQNQVMEEMAKEAAPPPEEENDTVGTPEPEAEAVPGPDGEGDRDRGEAESGGVDEDTTGEEDAEHEEGTSEDGEDNEVGDESATDEAEVEDTGTELHTVTIDGEQHEVSVEELKTGYQLAKASRRRFQDAAAKEKEALEVLTAVTKNPVDALIGMWMPHVNNNRQQAEEQTFQMLVPFVSSFLEEKAAPAEQQEAIRRKRESEQLDRDIQKKQLQKQQLDEQEQMMAYAKNLDREIGTALESTGLPNDPEVIREIADLLEQALQSEYELTPLDAARTVKETRGKRISKAMTEMPPEEVLEKYPEYAEKISKALANKVKKKSKKPRSTGKGKRGKPTDARRRGDQPEVYGTSREYRQAIQRDLKLK